MQWLESTGLRLGTTMDLGFPCLNVEFGWLALYVNCYSSLVLKLKQV